jgi:hypothetical protein
VQRQSAQRILGLIAFALRPLKCHEICDGLVFQEEHGILNEETKLGGRLLDICKPLIEDRRAGYVSLVHFSAREFVSSPVVLQQANNSRYLVSPTSGPYLSAPSVHADIALSCLRYLRTSKIFLAEAKSKEAAVQILKGFHDLFPYAHEFWIEHLLLSLPAEVARTGDHRKIKGLLAEMSSFQKNPSQVLSQLDSTLDLCSPTPPTPTTPTETATATGADCDRLAKLSDCPEPVRNYILFRNGSLDKGLKSCKELGQFVRCELLID